MMECCCCCDPPVSDGIRTGSATRTANWWEGGLGEGERVKVDRECAGHVPAVLRAAGLIVPLSAPLGCAEYMRASTVPGRWHGQDKRCSTTWCVVGLPCGWVATKRAWNLGMAVREGVLTRLVVHVVGAMRKAAAPSLASTVNGVCPRTVAALRVLRLAQEKQAMSDVTLIGAICQ